ncbi:hypothetical protein AB0O91_14100 [Kitasatospora sp. NPDC089797]
MPHTQGVAVHLVLIENGRPVVGHTADALARITAGCPLSVVGRPA